MRKPLLVLFILLLIIMSGCKGGLMTLEGENNRAVLGIPGASTVYFIDAQSGDDGNSGLAESEAWQSLEKVNGTEFGPGDRILFKAGDSWNGMLWPKGSGSIDSPIVIDQYGTGNKPLIIGGGTADLTGAVQLIDQEYWEINNLLK